MIPILLKALKTGIVTEPAPQAREEWLTRSTEIRDAILRLLGRALVIREVDAGSCNGCELEIHALGNPYYNLEGLGIRFAASPRHADMLLVTGPVSKNMEQALRHIFEAYRGHVGDARRLVSSGATHRWRCCRKRRVR